MKSLFRTIFKSKTYVVLNILGLAIGIACAGLILLWVENELTFSDYPKQKQLYVVCQNQSYSGEVYTFMVAPNPLASALKEEVPGVKEAIRYNGYDKSLFTLKDKMIYEVGAHTDPGIFDMLDIEFVRGNAATAFDGAYPLVITESMALKFFGDEDPVGKSLKRNNMQEYQVTAVVKDPKPNSEFVFSFLIPFDRLVASNVENGWVDAGTNWWNNWMTDYVELEPSADVDQVNSKLKTLLTDKRQEQDNKTELFLYPVSKLRLYSEFKDGKPTGSGYIHYVKLFSWIAIVILVIACINYMNLSTARAQKRILEVGVRKTFGAKRGELVRQFMAESGIVTLLSLIFAVVFVVLTLPLFNTLTGKELALGGTNMNHWLGLVAIGLLCSIVAGSYPSFYLSSFPPIDVLRKLKVRSATGVVWLRKGLVVFQFAISLVLIICTVFIYLQVQHAKNRSLGMNINQVVTMDTNENILNHYQAIRQKLLSGGVVENMGLSDQAMLNIWSNSGGWSWEGKPDNIDPLVSNARINAGLLQTLDISMKEGEFFREEYKDSIYDNARIINETMANIMGEEGRVGGRLWIESESGKNVYTIIGIVHDFVVNNMFGTSGTPIVFYHAHSSLNRLFIRLKTTDTQKALAVIENVMKEFDPDHPFKYGFMDEQFNRQFSGVLLIGKLSGLFTLLAVFISCLGLFGLTAFSAEQRTREIGIRKVLGATVWDVTRMLGQNFLLLIAIAFVVAIPVSWYLMHSWLQKYEYRINENAWVFVGSGLLVLLIAMLTVGFQAVRAATANPVKSIKTD